MAKAKRYYDTSKYISLPVALVFAFIVLVILVLIGIKYSVFEQTGLTIRARPSGEIGELDDLPLPIPTTIKPSVVPLTF